MFLFKRKLKIPAKVFSQAGLFSSKKRFSVPIMLTRFFHPFVLKKLCKILHNKKKQYFFLYHLC